MINIISRFVKIVYDVLKLLKQFFVFLILILLLSTCSTSDNLISKNNYYINGINNTPQPRHIIYHRSDSITTLFLDFNSKSLLYSKANFDDDFKSILNIKYSLYSVDDNVNTFVDSNTTRFVDLSGFNKEIHICDSIDVRIISGQKYLLDVFITDINRKTNANVVIAVNKTTEGNRQYFMPRYKNGAPLFENLISAKDSFYFEVSDKSKNEIHIRRFRIDFPVAKSPYLMFHEPEVKYKYDSSFSYKLVDRKTPLMTLPTLGFYHFQLDTFNKEGFTVFRFYEDYPDLTEAEQLILPLKYLTSQDDYRILLVQKDKKQALDNYWHERAGNVELAKNMIRQFYNRVRNSNIYFTSCAQGWKTDRGIIYIIYGRPSTVIKKNSSEVWIYGENNSYTSITFTFAKNNNPFTENDYKLVKSPVYKDSWHNMMNKWYH